MASRLLGAITRRRLVLGGGAIASAGAGLGLGLSNDTGVQIAAIKELNTASKYAVPASYKQPPFRLKINFPQTPENLNSQNVAALATGRLPGPVGIPEVGDPNKEFPWLDIDYLSEEGARRYCDVLKEYCYEGFDWNETLRTKTFDIWNNKIREWFHAPWMHWGITGREPLNGMTFERKIDAYELSQDQTKDVYNYAVGFYNYPGATVFGSVWREAHAPVWTDHIVFPVGTCVFKLLATTATDKEFPILKDAPALNVLGCPISPRGYVIEDNTDGTIRRVVDAEPSELRMLQLDFAVRDDRAPTGWAFGTFMYDGSQTASNPWDRFIPVGLQWGNDPDAVHAGDEIKERWINPYADKLRTDMKGTRGEWGWHGRMNGPVDNFVSACASCHSTAQRRDPVLEKTTRRSPMVPYDSMSDEKRKPWFRNLKWSDSDPAFNQGFKSADYSLQMAFGYGNFVSWQDRQPRSTLDAAKKLIFRQPPLQPMDVLEERHPLPPKAENNVQVGKI